MRLMGDTAFLAIDLFGLLLIVVVLGYQIYFDCRGRQSRRKPPGVPHNENAPEYPCLEELI